MASQSAPFYSLALHEAPVALLWPSIADCTPSCDSSSLIHHVLQFRQFDLFLSDIVNALFCLRFLLQSQAQCRVRIQDAGPNYTKTFAKYLEREFDKMEKELSTLNLICITDIENWLSSNGEAKAIYRSAIAKCSAVWTKASRSTAAAEIVEEFGKRSLLVPCKTWWNSFYNAMRRVTDMPLPDLNSLCTQLGIRALDILQGENNCFYGTILPTLESLMTKTLELKDSLSCMTSGLADTIIKAVKTRFASTLESEEALLAAVTHPKFKLH
ncbi:hypothetical protein ABVT39_001635 [Epinephelus coioides]